MWILPPTKEQQEKQEREMAERMAKRHAEWNEQHEKKEEWLKANTCPHCGQHPPIPPWFEGY